MARPPALHRPGPHARRGGDAAPTIDVQSLNVDEADTFLLLHRSFTGMLTHLVNTESSPPLYYALAWIWTRVFGLTTFGLRSFSAVVGALTIPAMYAAGRVTSERAGLWAAALTTFSSSMFFYSQETRCYPLLVLFVALAYIYWRRSMDDGGRRDLVMWGVLMAVALLTHYFALFIFVPQVVLLWRRVGVRRVALPAGLVCLVGLALVPLAAAERADGKTNWIEELSLPGRIVESVKVLTVSKYTLLVFPVVVAFLVLSAASLWLVATRGAQRERTAAFDAFIVFAAAIGIPLVLAAGHVIDIFDGANVLVAWVPLTLLIAYGVGSRSAGTAGTVIGTLLCAIGLAMVVATNLLPAYQRDDWRDAAATLGQPAAPRAIEIVSHNIDGLQWYLRDLRTVPGGSVHASEVDFVALRSRRTVGAPLAPVVPTSGLPGFTLAGVHRHAAYAVSIFRAPEGASVSVAAIRHAAHEPYGEVILQR